MRASLVGALAAALLLAGCAQNSSGGGFVAGDGALTRVPADQRVAAPHLQGTTLDGKPFDSASLAGQVIVYNVWGSWCAPCRKEASDLQAAAQATAGKASFVGINTRDTGTAQGQAFARQFGVTYPSLYDPDGTTLLQFPALPPSAIPSTVVVDAHGKIAARILGSTTKDTLVGIIDDTAAGR